MRSISETVEPPKINGWMRPKELRSVKLRKFLEQFKLYCENSSLNGCKYFTEPGRHWAERIIWVILYVVMICGVAYVVFDVYAEYRRSPIVTTEDKDMYPTKNVAFPGRVVELKAFGAPNSNTRLVNIILGNEGSALALCTLNRISYKSASALAESIFEANISTSSSKEILQQLRYLGHLYDYTYKSFESEHETLHNMLTQFYNGEYDPNEIMRNLTPPCRDVILNCAYGGKPVPCSQIFTFRKTQDGYCCTFNYVRQSDEFIPATGYNRTGYQSKVLQPLRPGANSGLSILIEPLLDDYFYTIPSGRGWKVVLFNSEDYPDNPSGGVIEQIISPSTETYLRLDAILFFTPDEIINYPVHKRKCIFNTELQKLFTGYTYSDCIVNCRVEDIWQTCECLPFFFPKRDNRRTCDMTDLPCLSSNKSKWWVLFPHEVPDNDNDVNLQAMRYETVSGIDCSECFPACNDVRYFVQNSVTGLTSGGHYATNLSHNITLVDHSIVHVYFGDFSVPRLKQDVIYYWYELLSNIGGICGVFVGFSLISALELLFFLLLPILPVKKKRTNDTQKRLQVEWHSNTAVGDATLYWKELGMTGRRWSVKERRTAQRYLRGDSIPVAFDQ